MTRFPLSRLCSRSSSGRSVEVAPWQRGTRLANPLVKIARSAVADMVNYGGEFGLTPRGRSYLDTAGGHSGPGKFDGLLA